LSRLLPRCNADFAEGTLHSAIAAISSTECSNVRANFVQLRDIALAFAAIDSDITIKYPESDFVRIQIGLSGFATTTAGGQTVEINERQSCITSTGWPSEMVCGDTRRLTLLFLSLVLLGMSAPGLAASLQVTPALIDFTAPDAASTLTLRNGGQVSINVQFRVFRWSQSAGFSARPGTPSATCWKTMLRTRRPARCATQRNTSKQIGIIQSALNLR